jgi:hypothetical protein
MPAAAMKVTHIDYVLSAQQILELLLELHKKIKI